MTSIIVTFWWWHLKYECDRRNLTSFFKNKMTSTNERNMGNPKPRSFVTADADSSCVVCHLIFRGCILYFLSAVRYPSWQTFKVTFQKHTIIITGTIYQIYQSIPNTFVHVSTLKVKISGYYWTTNGWNIYFCANLLILNIAYIYVYIYMIGSLYVCTLHDDAFEQRAECPWNETLKRSRERPLNDNYTKDKNIDNSRWFW